MINFIVTYIEHKYSTKERVRIMKLERNNLFFFTSGENKIFKSLFLIRSSGPFTKIIWEFLYLLMSSTHIFRLMWAL